MAHPDAGFKEYVIFGGMPHITPLKLDYSNSMKVLRDSYNSAILQDVVRRYNIRNVSSFKDSLFIHILKIQLDLLMRLF